MKRPGMRLYIYEDYSHNRREGWRKILQPLDFLRYYWNDYSVTIIPPLADRKTLDDLHRRMWAESWEYRFWCLLKWPYYRIWLKAVRWKK